MIITEEGRYGEVGEEWDALARIGLVVWDLTRWNFPSFSSPCRPSFLIAMAWSKLTKKNHSNTMYSLVCPEIHRVGMIKSWSKLGNNEMSKPCYLPQP